jgi:hypothetical protein
MESVNGLTRSWNQYGFLEMKRQKNMRTVNVGLLFPWYSVVAIHMFVYYLFMGFLPMCYIVVLLVKHYLLQGSTKGAILGEVFLNMTNYLSSEDSTAISLPLKKCNSGTVLQVGFNRCAIPPYRISKSLVFSYDSLCSPFF